MANTSRRGFASMDAAKQREIASKGGKAAHAKGTAHEFTSDEARVAGRKGGEAVSRDRAHMSAIGREGGHSRGARARATTQTPGNTGGGNGGNQSFESSSRGPAPSDRGSYNTSASDRGNSGNRTERTNERQSSNNDRQTENDRFASRDEI
jgi:uncharacterized protein